MKNVFEADFARKTPELSCTRLLVSPVNARSRVLDFIASAKTTLTIESMQFQDPEVREAVVDRARDGVSVRVLLAEPEWISANAAALEFLSTNGIPSRTRPNLHVKAIVVDGSSAYVGSENLSATSLDKNREIGLLTREPDAVGTVRATFELDWTAATSP